MFKSQDGQAIGEQLESTDLEAPLSKVKRVSQVSTDATIPNTSARSSAFEARDATIVHKNQVLEASLISLLWPYGPKWNDHEVQGFSTTPRLDEKPVPC